jgi:hypothetical protein
LKKQWYTNKWIINLKKRIENIGSLIEGWCKKKLVFAHPLLPFGTVREAHAHCTHLQITQADAQTKTCQRVWQPKHTLKQKMIKHENTTRYIKHLADSANFKDSAFNKHCNGLIGNRFEMPNVSYTHPFSCTQ